MSSADRLVLGYCHHGMVHEPFMRSVLHFMTQDRQGLCRQVLDANYPYIPLGRNDIVRRFLQQQDADWLLFLDYDIMFAPAHVLDLFAQRSAERQIIAGLYFQWDGGEAVPVWTMQERTGEFTRVREIAPLGQWIDISGMGFTLIHREVLITMQDRCGVEPWPWFGHDIVWMNDRNVRVGEDATFCLRARGYGFKVWGYPVAVTHIKTHPVDMAAFMRRGGERRLVAS